MTVVGHLNKIMKSLFIFYSYTGNGKLVAKELEKQGVEIREVISKRKMPKSFFFGVLTGGFLASIHAKDKLINFDTNIEGFDHIIIGSPIWNARFSSPINRVLHDLNLKDKKLTFILYAGSGEGKKAESRINKDYPGSKIIFLKEPKKFPEELKKLKI